MVMVTAHFRFYAGLNDFLAPQRRHREFACVCARAATAKHMIEALGAPHTEVAILLINGETCDFDRLLRDGDRVSVFPPFMTLDLGPLRRARPPGPVRFVADVHLGGLTRMLRMAGFDTVYDQNTGDADLAALAAREQRIVLTRDRDLLKRRNVTHGCYVRALKAADQFREIVERLDLGAQARPFTLCLHCNAPLRTVDKALVLDRLPPAVQAAHTEFSICDLCQGVFWKGSHWKRMCAVLAAAHCAS
jgi:uncharacterized protein with PIN domain/molybdopterin converting factor small subunit